jgi:hypothetical protein
MRDGSSLIDMAPMVLGYLPAMIPGVIALVIAGTTRDLPGRAWLIAYGILAMLTQIARAGLMVGMYMSEEGFRSYDWDPSVALLGILGGACLSIFLVSLWIAPRFSFTTNALVFGFKGRIPRSVFWLMTAIQLVYFLSIYAQLMHISPSGFLGGRRQPLPRRSAGVVAGRAVGLGLWGGWAVGG